MPLLLNISIMIFGYVRVLVGTVCFIKYAKSDRFCTENIRKQKCLPWKKSKEIRGQDELLSRKKKI